VWKNKAKTKLRPPQDEKSFYEWLWQLVKEFGPGDYAVVRTQVKGEKRGFHAVGFYSIDGERLIVLKRFPDVKSHPGLPSSRQVWHKGTLERKRLRSSGRGKKRF